MPAIPPPQKKRRLWLRLLGAFLIAVIVVVGGALVYLQSSHAFVHIVLPAAERALGETVEADSGSVSLFGNIEAENLRYAGADGKDILTAQSVALKLSYYSLAKGPRPVIESAVIEGPKVYLRQGEEEEKEERQEAEKENEKEGKGAEKEGNGAKKDPKALIPVEIRSLRIRNLGLEVQREDEATFVLSAADVEIDDLAPGGKAKAKLKTNFAVSPGAEDERTGTFEIDLAVDQSGDAMKISWAGTSNAVLAEPAAEKGKKSIITFDLPKFEGSHDAKGALKAVVSAAADRDKKPAGKVDATVDYDWSGEKARVDSVVELKEIGREILNPILAAQGEARFESAKIDGKLKIKSDGGEIALDSTIKGRGLSLRARKGEKPTPPLNFDTRQEAVWNPAKETATIREASAALDREGEPLGKLKLEKPMTIDLKGEEAGGDAAPGEETRLTLELTRLSAENIRPWAEIAGVEAFRDVEEGEISGTLDLSVVGSGEKLGWNGDLTVASLVLRRGDVERLGPLKIESKVKGGMAERDQVTIEPTRLALSDADGALAQASISGAYGVKSGKAAVKIDGDSADLSKALNRLGFLGVKGEPTLKGGKLKTSITLARASKDEALRFDGATHIEGIVPVDPKTGEAKGEPSTIDHELKGTFKEPSSLDVESLKAEIVAEGKKLAEALASGSFDFKTGLVKANARIDVADVATTIRRLGSPMEGQPYTLTGGKLAATVAVTRAGEDAEAVIDATALGEKLTITTDKGRKIEPRMETKAKIAIAPHGREAKFEAVSVKLSEKADAQPGAIDLKGYWPLENGKQSRGGKIDVTIQRLNTGAWMDALGWTEGRDIGDAPLEAKLLVSVDPSGEKFTFEGEETLGPIKLAGGDNASQETTLRLNNKIEKLGDDIKSFVVELAGTRAQGEPDKARVTGSAKLGKRPSLTADVQIDKFDARGYPDPLAPRKKEGEAAAEGAAGEATAGAEKEKDKGSAVAEGAGESAKGSKDEAFPIDMDVKMRIGSLDWRQVKVRDAAATATSDKDSLNAEIAKMGLNDGTLLGTFAIDGVGEARKITWKGEGDGIEIGPFLASFNPEGKAKVRGKARIATEGVGAGTGDAFKRSLAGKTIFSVADGQFGESGLLDALSEATRTNVFREMVFKGFDGEIELKDGDALLNRVTVDSNAARLVAKGKIGLDRTLDVTVQPGLGPEALRRLPQDTKWLGPISSALGSATDVLDLPIAMGVSGTTDKPRYLPALVAPELIGGAIGTLGKGAGALGKGAGAGLEGIMDLNPFKKKEEPKEGDAAEAAQPGERPEAKPEEPKSEKKKEKKKKKKKGDGDEK